MKPCLLPMLLSILFAACKKDFQPAAEPDFQKVKNYLKTNLRPNEFNKLDFSAAQLNNYDDKKTSVVYVPINQTGTFDTFFLIEVDELINPIKARRVHLSENYNNSDFPRSPYTFDGAIIIECLDGTVLTNSVIAAGEILSFRNEKKVDGELLSTRRNMAPPPVVPDNTWLPEVIVVARRTTIGDISYSTWMNYLTIITGSPYLNSSGSYNMVSPTGSGSSGSTVPTTSPGSPTSGSSSGPVPSIVVDFENAQQQAAIDLVKYLKCFSNVPDNGATCSIEIFIDIPVDSDPMKALNYSTGSPGHTFLQIKKSNGSQSVTQNIGFYPVSGWKTGLTTAPVRGKFVDNANHEFNASFKMNLKPEQLSSIITHMLALNNYVRYDIDDYNCTDLALEVFNQARIDPLLAVPVAIPGGMRPDSNTPQGLYMALNKMKESGNAESANIWISTWKGYTGGSNGPCN
jgi:hypothetical protein